MVGDGIAHPNIHSSRLNCSQRRSVCPVDHHLFCSYPVYGCLPKYPQDICCSFLYLCYHFSHATYFCVAVRRHVDRGDVENTRVDFDVVVNRISNPGVLWNRHAGVDVAENEREDLGAKAN